MSYFTPWTKYPSLTEEHLSIVAQIIRDARRGAVLRYQPEHGDNRWSLGCTSYVRTCASIVAAGKQHDWLGTLPEPKFLAFSFAIGAVPFRFYKGKPDEPPDRYLISTFGELHHQQLCFEIEGLRPVDKILRLAIETDESLEVSDITCVELDDAGNVTGDYPIPRIAAQSNVMSIQLKPMVIPPPPLEVRKARKSQKEESRWKYWFLRKFSGANDYNSRASFVVLRKQIWGTKLRHRAH